MSNIVHTCSGCVPIDASILKVYAAMVAAISQSRGLVIDDALSGVSKNPVENRAITNALASKYTKPASGIPAEDIAEGVIPDVSGFITKSVNDLVNYYLKSETYNRSEVQELIGAIQGFSYEVVASLPTASASTKGKIYLVPSGDPQAQNVKDEFITIDNGASANPRYTWEQIGSTSVDLSGYVTTTQLNTALAAYTTTEALTALLAAKQDTISDLSTIRSGAAAGATAYQKPQTGIPASDLASGVIPTVPTDIVKYSSQSLTDAQQTQARTNIGAAAAAALTALETAIAAKYTKPSSGIPETDLDANVQSALALARTSIQSLADYYSKTEVDALLDAVGSEQYVDVTTLPTASASTLGKIYLVGPDANGFYDRYYTSYDGSTYSWVAAGNTEINLANYATKAELSQLQQKVYDIREYGTLDKYIRNSNWTAPSSGGTLSKYIAVRKGDTIRIVRNSEYQIYCAFIASIDTSVPAIFANGTSAVIRNIDDATLLVSSDCYFWWLVDQSSAQHWEPSVLTLNGQDILNETYSINRISEIQEGLDDVQEGLDDVQEGLDDVQEGFGKMVGTYEPKKMLPVDWGTPVEGKYWNLVNGIAGMVSAANYYARPNLYPVNPGQKMSVTVNNSIINEPAAAAYAGYDNDGYPAYDGGTVARRNWSSAASVIDNGDGTTTYTFILGSSVTQVGLFYKGEEVTFYFEKNESFAYSQTLDDHIQEVAGGGATASGDSARYYLKGSSPKSFSSAKKICILAAGQSNIDGRVPYANMPAEIQTAQPISNCHYVKNSESGAFSSLNITGNWAFDLVTYYNIARSQELYVIKWSQGGTSIDPLGDGTNHWTADYEKLSSESNSLLLKFENEIRNHIALNGENFDIRAMLWHQGESDRASLGTGAADRYYDNLRNMISYVRGIVGNERLPIVTGTISENSGQYDATVHAAQVRLASEDPYFVLIDMSGAPLLDNYHFNAASSVYLGQMAYNALIDLGVISGTKLTPTRPW